MAKRGKVTAAELDDLMERLQDIVVDLSNLTDRIQADLGWAEDVKAPASYARTLCGTAAAASEASHAFLIRLAMAEDREALEVSLRASIGK